MHCVAFGNRNVDISHEDFLGHDLYICCDFPTDGRVMVYAPTLKLLADCELDNYFSKNESEHGLLNRIIREQPEIQYELQSRACNHKSPSTYLGRKAKFFPLSVAITRNCSLACKYCHAEAGRDSDGNDAILHASLQHAVCQVQKKSLKGLHVSFAVGGEPTYRWKKFTNFVRQVNEAAQEGRFGLHKAITTNGYYGPQKRAFLASEFDSILLSFDGPKAIHDRLRPTKAGRSSFDLVLASARYFSKYAKSFAVRCTVTESSLEQIEEIVSFFIEIAALQERHDIVLEPMIAIGRGTHDAHLQPSGEAFAKSFWRAYQYGKVRGYRVKSSAFNATRLVTAFCHAMSIPSFAVIVDGKVTACERDCDGQDYAYGTFDGTTETFVLDNDAIHKNELRAAVPTHCDCCICKWHCAGDCPDTRRFGYDRCVGNRFLLLAHLKELLETKSKGGLHEDRSDC